jgi:hemerythrin-like domain-containing protein
MSSDGRAIEAVFFDVRDTLGEVDRPGHLEPYRPSTEKLLQAMRDAVGLRIGVITNLPDDVTADQGREMLENAVLSEDAQTGETISIRDFVDADGIVINHEAGASKPDARIYRYAAERIGVPIERCLFVGENLIEVLGARTAGMNAELKPCPPGREFQPAVITRVGESKRDSGRAFEHFLEHEHLLGDRIFECGSRIVEQLRELPEGGPIPDKLHQAMGILIYLTNNFADQAHLKAEEAAIPIAIARGMNPRDVAWVYFHHDQGRAYFHAMDVAWQRIQAGEERDMPLAIDAFARSTEGFVQLFIEHAERENDELYPLMGRYFSDTDDTLVLNLLDQVGPSDFTPYIGLVSAMEEALGVAVPA